MILCLLGNEMIQLKTRVKENEPDLQKQLKIEEYIITFSNFRCSGAGFMKSLSLRPVLG